MNTARKIVTLLLGLYECLFFGGVVFGWVSLVVVFESEGYFGCGEEDHGNNSYRRLSRRSDLDNLTIDDSSSITVESLVSNITTTLGSVIYTTVTVLSTADPVSSGEVTQGYDRVVTTGVEKEETCTKQEENLQLVFTISTFMLNSLTLVNGYIFDRFGTRKTRILAIFGYLSGTLMLAFSNKELSVLLYPAMALISVCGILLLITNMQIGNLFGSRRGTVITMFNGAFDSSSFVFLIFKLLYQSGIALHHIFYTFSGLMVVFLINTFFLLPSYRIPWPLPQDWGATKLEEPEMPVLEDSEKRLHNPRLSLDGEMQDGEAWTMRNGDSNKKVADVYEKKFKPPPSTSFSTMATSGLYLWSVVWLSIMQLKVWFFIGTLKPFLEAISMKNPSIVDSYLTVFGFIQFGGIFLAPLVGMAVDRNKIKHKKLLKMRKMMNVSGSYDVTVDKRTALDDLEDVILPVIVTSTVGLIFSISAVIPFMPLQIFTFITKVIMRAFLYALNAAFLATAFPQEHFGKLYGLSMFISAIIGALQFPLFMWVQGSLEGDPLYVNLLLLFAGLLTYIFPYVIWRVVKHRQIKQHALTHLTESEEYEDDNSMPPNERDIQPIINNSIVNGNALLNFNNETTC